MAGMDSAAARTSLAVVILAGGEGRRMGGAKPLRQLGTRSLLDRAIERASEWSDTIAISARDRGQVCDRGWAVLSDPPGIAGPFAGLAAARELRSARVRARPCDMPFLPGDLPQQLAAVLPGHAAALASAGGRLHPVCGLWTRGALDQIEAYAASGNSSVVGFAESVGFATAELDEEASRNINTPEELAAAQSRAG
jgi:molybdopterin-guanine dinucleotide biosynthesis protein A